jgi:FdhD protein
MNHYRWAMPPPRAYADGVSAHRSLRSEGASHCAVDDVLIEELPISLEFNGEAAIVMMATPVDVEAFALGFALTEGIIDNPSQMLELHAVPAECGMAVVMTLAHGLWQRAQARKRDRAAGSSCSLCGLADMQQALHAPQVAPSGLRFNTAVISAAFAALPALQTIGAQTGAAHAAAFVSPQGEILAIAEDAGRHNTLDKLVGMMAQNGLHAADGFCAITSRASFEMVQKAARVGFPMLCAISAPTALAVRLANESGITLCAFVRGERLTCLSHGYRIQLP